MSAGEVLVPVAEKSALAAMMQDYIAEMAQIIPGVRVGQPYPQFDLYWTEPESRWPFWLIVDGINAGFALVSRDVPTGLVEMEEFFEDIRLKRTPVPGLREAKAVLQIVERIYARGVR